MRALALCLALLSAPCLAQKWVDDKGRIYYGERPAGIKVKAAPIFGGTSSSVGPQGGASASGAPAGASAPGGMLQSPPPSGSDSGALRDNDQRMSVEDRERMRQHEERWQRFSEGEKQRIRQRQRCINAGGHNC